MWKLVVLAARNLRRNPRRTALTLAAVGFGLGMMIVAVNLEAGQHDDLERAAVASLAGDLVIHAQGYRADPESHRTVGHVADLQRDLAAAFPGAVLTPRIALQGLLTSPTAAVGVALSGIDPAAEAQVQDLPQQVVTGQWLTDDPKGIVIGQGVADALQVGLGDKVVFMGQYETEEVQSRLFRVQGIFRTGAADLDARLCWAPLAAAQALLLQPDTANQLAIHLPAGQPGADALPQARAVVAERLGPEASSVEVLGWRDALPDIAALLAIDTQSNDVVRTVLGVIVSMGVLNTVLMSVLERTREFGVLLAIGMRPARLFALVLIEGLLLGAAGGLIGVALGAALTYPLSTWGLDYTEVLGQKFENGGVYVSALIRARYDWPRTWAWYAAAVAATVAAAVYPAWSVLRMTPVDAMRRT
jgi:ABC-type lipoprotein release transport system permease subunit